MPSRPSPLCLPLVCALGLTLSTSLANLTPASLIALSQPTADFDADGLTHAEELLRGTDPNISDTDGDGVADPDDGWPRHALITRAPLPPTGYAMIPLRRIGFPETGTLRYTDASELNDRGDILGYFPGTDKLLYWHAATWTATEVPLRYYNYFHLLDDNYGQRYHSHVYHYSKLGAQGQVIAQALSTSGTNAYAAKWELGLGLTALESESYTSSPTAINANGEVVGWRSSIQVMSNGSDSERGGARWPGGTWLGGESQILRSRRGLPGTWPTTTMNGASILPYALNAEGLIGGRRDSANQTYDYTANIWLGPRTVQAVVLDGAQIHELGEGIVWRLTSGPSPVALGTTPTPLWGETWEGPWWAHRSAEGAWQREPLQNIWDPSVKTSWTPIRLENTWRINDRLEIIVGASNIIRNGELSQIPIPSGWRNLNLYAINNHGTILAQARRTIDSAGLPIDWVNQVYEPVLLMPSTLTVDANRDGTISNQDVNATTPSTPFVFWVNSDDDDWVDWSNLAYEEWEQDDREITNPNMEDWRDRRIDDTRDLEDLFRLRIQFSGLVDAIEAGNIKIGLKWSGISRGTPAIKLHHSIEEDGGTGYLFDPTVAADQYARDYAAISDERYSDPDNNLIEGSSVFVLPRYIFQHPSYQNYRDTAHLLFEGCKSGAGHLKIVILNQNDQEIGEGPGVWLDIKQPHEFIERFTCGDGDRQAVGALLRHAKSATFPAPAKDEERDYVLYVHGYNMQEYEKQRWIETVYKRLHWLGYKGRVGGFTWPCSQSPLPYDASEERAWESATRLLEHLANLKAQGYRVHVIGHSQGNVVVGEALRQWKEAGNNTPLVRTYIASQAAVPADCYDPQAPLIPDFAGSLTDDGTPNVYVNYPPTSAPYLGVAAVESAATNWFNFENPRDYALTGNSLNPFDFHPGWQVNQRLKPDQGFTYNVVDGFLEGTAIGYKSLHLPADRFRIFSYAAEGRSLALGSTPTGGVFSAGSTDLSLAPLNYGREHRFHSAQFRASHAERYQYWQFIMQVADLTPIGP